MLAFLTVAIALGVAYAYLVEGLFTAFTMCFSVLAAGLVAFNFFEPIATALEPSLGGSFLAGYEDALALVSLFAITLGVLRTIINNLTPIQVEFHQALQAGGGALFGLITGYLVTGFLVCVLQTLPWQENFLGFNPEYNPEAGLRAVLPADRVWLGLMYRAGAYPFANNQEPKAPEGAAPYDRYKTFDQYGTFEIRYARYRRYGEKREALPYSHEFDRELGR